MPFAISTSTSASVPLATPIACRAPQNSPSARSRSPTSGPLINWQCSVTRAMASSMRLPRRRRCAVTSMKGIESIRVCWFITNPGTMRLARNLARLAGRNGHAALQAPHRDFEARHALGAGHRGRLRVADRLDEREQLGAQRLGMAGGEMPHRIAAIGLEAEAFGHLPRQQVADEIFLARCDVHGTCLERGEPVGVDLSEHARLSTELEQRDVLALRDRALDLRLHLGDL